LLVVLALVQAHEKEAVARGERRGTVDDSAAEAASSGRGKELRARRRVPSGEHPGSGTKASWRDESVPRHRLVVK
jgi:hypothetical protein